LLYFVRLKESCSLCREHAVAASGGKQKIVLGQNLMNMGDYRLTI
jgi:hypothetical protein